MCLNNNNNSHCLLLKLNNNFKKNNFKKNIIFIHKNHFSLKKIDKSIICKFNLHIFNI